MENIVSFLPQLRLD